MGSGEIAFSRGNVICSGEIALSRTTRTERISKDRKEDRRKDGIHDIKTY